MGHSTPLLLNYLVRFWLNYSLCIITNDDCVANLLVLFRFHIFWFLWKHTFGKKAIDNWVIDKAVVFNKWFNLTSTYLLGLLYNSGEKGWGDYSLLFFNEIVLQLHIKIISIEIIIFWLIFALTGIHFRGKLKYFGHVGWQIWFWPSRTQKSLISIWQVFVQFCRYFACLQWF